MGRWWLLCVLIGPLVLTCNGCMLALATVLRPIPRPKPIRLLAVPPSEASDGGAGASAEIVVFRTGLAGFLTSFGIFVNDWHVGELRHFDMVRHAVPPGLVRMFAGAERRSPALFPVTAGRTYYFRVRPIKGRWFMRPQLEVVTPEEAARGIKWCDDRTFDTPAPFPFELELRRP